MVCLTVLGSLHHLMDANPGDNVSYDIVDNVIVAVNWLISVAFSVRKGPYLISKYLLLASPASRWRVDEGLKAAREMKIFFPNPSGEVHTEWSIALFVQHSPCIQGDHFNNAPKRTVSQPSGTGKVRPGKFSHQRERKWQSGHINRRFFCNVVVPILDWSQLPVGAR